MKKNSILVIFFILAISFAMPNKVKAQIMEVGVTGGLSYYVGDINPRRHFAQSEIGFGGVVRYYQNTRWAFRFQYSNLSLKSSDEIIAFRPERGLAFNSKINDFAFIAEFNFFDYWTGSDRDFITPYLFAGISAFTFDTKAPDGTALSSLQTEGVSYSTFAVSVPFGIGLKYSLTKRIGLTLEWRIHKAFTDYIDDVSGLYPESPAIVNDYNYTDPTGNFKPGMQRGNGTTTLLGYNCDWYSMLGFSIVYRFNLPKKDACYSGIKARY